MAVQNCTGPSAEMMKSQTAVPDVMWAITPEGQATNIGEVILNGTKSKLYLTTELQAFGLVVTAEPYLASRSLIYCLPWIRREPASGKQRGEKHCDDPYHLRTPIFGEVFTKRAAALER